MHGYVRRARLAGAGRSPLPEGLDDESLELLLFPAPTTASQKRPTPVTGLGLCRRNCAAARCDAPVIVGRVSRRQSGRLGCHLVLHDLRGTWEAAGAAEHRHGPRRPEEKVFVDFAGDTIDIFDPIAGEVRAMKLFKNRGDGGLELHLRRGLSEGEGLSDWIGMHACLFR